MQVKQSRFILVFVGLIVIGLVIVIINALVWTHLHTVTAQYLSSYKKTSDEFNANQKAINNLPEDQKTLRLLETELSSIDANLADYSYVPTYLEEIKQVTEQTHNVVSSISPGIPKPLDLTKGPFAAAASPAAGTPSASDKSARPDAWSNYQTLSIELDVKGNYLSIIQLLDEFSRFPKMIYVQNVELTPSTVKGINTISARFKTYAIITPNQYQQGANNTMHVGAGGRL
jgi:Tfp pilus assembly protein PilO